MARKPNYNFERLERQRQKTAKRAARTEAKRLVAAMKGKPFIFNLGHGVMQPTPPENVADLIAAVRAQ